MMPFTAIAQVFERLDEFEKQVGLNAREPALIALHHGGIAMVCTEADGKNFAIKTTIFTDKSWTEPVTVV